MQMLFLVGDFVHNDLSWCLCVSVVVPRTPNEELSGATCWGFIVQEVSGLLQHSLKSSILPLVHSGTSLQLHIDALQFILGTVLYLSPLSRCLGPSISDSFGFRVSFLKKDLPWSTTSPSLPSQSASPIFWGFSMREIKDHFSRVSSGFLKFAFYPERSFRPLAHGAPLRNSSTTT